MLPESISVHAPRLRLARLRLRDMLSVMHIAHTPEILRLAQAGDACVHVVAEEANGPLARLQTYDPQWYALPPFMIGNVVGVTLVHRGRVADALERDRQQRWAKYFARGCY